MNAADDATRNQLMPINRKYPLDPLIQACREFPLPHGKRITFEYILIKGVNDSPKEARALARLLKGVKAKINLIPFNAHPGIGFEPPPEKDLLTFQDILIRSQYTAIIRRRGRYIGGLRPAPCRMDQTFGRLTRIFLRTDSISGCRTSYPEGVGEE